MKNGSVTIDLSDILLSNFDFGDRNITIPTGFNASDYLPKGFNISRLDNLGLKIPGNPLFDGNIGKASGLTPSTLIQGNITLRLDFAS